MNIACSGEGLLRAETLACLVILIFALSLRVVIVLNREAYLRRVIQVQHARTIERAREVWQALESHVPVSVAQKRDLLESFRDYTEGRASTLTPWIRQALPYAETQACDDLRERLVLMREGYVRHAMELKSWHADHAELLRDAPRVAGVFRRKPIPMETVSAYDAYRQALDGPGFK